MEQIVPVRKGSVTYALFFRGRPAAPGGVRFLTEPFDEFQTGVMERPAGSRVKPHTHPRFDRTVKGMSEFLYVEKGSIRVTVFDEEWKALREETLEPGDFLLFFRGGHGIDVLTDCRMIEVKQGPFVGDATVKFFPPES
ncbi:MAG: hypothetical protein WCS85_02720 [Candidatus Peribacteraceae bacterium]|jgi:quercetin dioxygenase-like cupin family protein